MLIKKINNFSRSEIEQQMETAFHQGVSGIPKPNLDEAPAYTLLENVALVPLNALERVTFVVLKMGNCEFVEN